MKVLSSKPARPVATLRAAHAGGQSLRDSRSEASGEMGRYCVARAMEAARVLENPDSSEEDQQVAREAMSEALRLMLSGP